MKDKATKENISHGDFRQLKYSTLSRRSLLALGGVVMLDIAGCGGGGSKKTAAMVTTFAGSGTKDSIDGTGAAASFYYPAGIALDGSGNLYVVDIGAHNVRKITTAGVVSTLAGSGVSESVDGTGVGAQFDSPQGIAVDGSGDLYVADTASHIIRKVTSAGVVTTFAGLLETAGSADGQRAAASFDGPTAIAVSGSGDVYVSDSGNYTIRKIDVNGLVTTLAGFPGYDGLVDGTGPEARFKEPRGIAVDGGGNIYVCDGGNHVIRKITPDGVVTTFAGSGMPSSVDGTGTAASFFAPSGIAIDSIGDFYVAEFAGSVIRKITAAGVVTTLAGSAGSDGITDGAASAARFSTPFGIAVDSSGQVFVSQLLAATIRKISY